MLEHLGTNEMEIDQSIQLPQDIVDAMEEMEWKREKARLQTELIERERKEKKEIGG